MTWGAGINGIYREQPSVAGKELALPAEFVRTDMDGQYLVFRLPVPEAAAANLQGLEQGEWVTATTPRDVSESSEAVTGIRAYNDVGDAS